MWRRPLGLGPIGAARSAQFFLRSRGRDEPSLIAPRTDPYERDYRIRLLPGMSNGEALLMVRVQHPWDGNPAIKKRSVPLPRHLPALTATSQNGPPHAPQTMHEYSQPIQVARNSVVLVITQSDLPKPLTNQRCSARAFGGSALP
jgi:hypothetical protein